MYDRAAWPAQRGAAAPAPKAFLRESLQASVIRCVRAVHEPGPTAPVLKKTVSVTAWSCYSCGSDFTAALGKNVKQKMLVHFVRDRHIETLRRRNGTGETAEQRSQTEAAARTVATEWRTTTALAIAQHSLPFTAGPVMSTCASTCAKKLLNIIAAGCDITPTLIKKVRALSPELATVLWRLRSATTMPSRQVNQNDPLMPMVVGNNAVGREITAQAGDLRDIFRAKLKSGGILALVVDESTRDGAGAKPCYVVIISYNQAGSRKGLVDDRCADVITCKDFKAVDADATTFLSPPEYDWETAIAETNNLSF